ncbi:MAG: hypothetical protein AAFO69_01440 [Bacteroidota bacterium]
MVTIGVAGCHHKTSFNDQQSLWSYLRDEDHGYLQTKEVNGVHYQLLYKPTDLVVSQLLRGKKASEATIDSLRQKYGQYLYFNLAMSQNGRELLHQVAGERKQFGALVNALAFDMDEKVNLFTNQLDTIPLLDYAYPRLYGMSNQTSVMLVYPKDQILKSGFIHLSIEDLGFGTGEVTFRQEVGLLVDQPTLRFSQYENFESTNTKKN